MCDKISANNSHSALIAESVLYLQKAVLQFESQHDSPSVAVRVAPIVTVTNGLLDAGLSPDDPLLQSSLQFLRQFYDDQKSLNGRGNISAELLAKIEACLEKTCRDATVVVPNDWQHDSPDHEDFLRNAFALLDNADDASDAISRASDFLNQLAVFDTNNAGLDVLESGIMIVAVDETQYVVSPGGGSSLRFREFPQAVAEFATLSLPDDFSTMQFDGLIASVHGMYGDLPLPNEPQLPKRESLFAAISSVPRSNDSRKKILIEQVSGCFSETSRSFSLAINPQPLIFQGHLLTGNLADLQTVRRLE